MSSVQGIHDTDISNVRVTQKMKASLYAYDAGAAATALEDTYPPVILCDPGGGAITMTLPVVTDNEGLCFHIFNTANAAETITVKDSTGTTTVVTLAQNKAGFVVCDGTAWHGYVGSIT